MSEPAAALLSPPFDVKRLLLIAFWVWWAISGIGFLSTEGLGAVWPLSLGLVWWLVLYFREPLQRMTRRVPLPLFWKFLLAGVFFYDVLMESLAVSFQGDLHPNLFWSNLLWLGACVGVLIAWYLSAHLYPFTAWQVFFIYGIKGVIIEQDFMVPLMAWKGQWTAVILVIPFLLVVYASAVAPVFVIFRDEMPGVKRLPGWLAGIGAMLATTAFFYGGAFVWFRVAERLFGLKVPA